MNTPEWFKVALYEIGQEETAGPKANPRIELYHATTTLRSASDEVSWCASFVCWALEKAGVSSTRSASSRSFLTWGKTAAAPFVGCVVVLSRGGDPTKGHVGFWVAENDEHVFVLGGNQDNAVNLRGYDKKRVLSYREPNDEQWSAKSGTH